MSKVKKSILLMAILPCFLWAQENPNSTGIEIARMQFQASQIIPPSPEAAELGKYGNVPVSLFTGTPKISVPLLELKGKKLSLPVSLSYNSSGFKPQDIAPWTGLGWALNAGGVITRSVIGDPDVDENYFKSPSPLAAVPDTHYNKQVYFLSIKNKEIETQPDIYYYNFMGYSGKFLIYPDGTISKKEKDLLKITSGIPGEGKSFTIVDENGIIYEFDAKEISTMVPYDDLPGAPPMITRVYTSAWYLTKVTAPFGNEELNFEYYSSSEAQPILPGSLVPQSVTFYRTDYTHTSGYNNHLWDSKPPEGSVNYFYTPAVTVFKKFIKKVSLKKNHVITGYIDFVSDADERQDLGDGDYSGERLLKKIKLFRSQGGEFLLTKQFDFSFGYFGNSQTNSPGFNYKRLKLKNVREISPDTTIVASPPPYVFDYFGEDDQMPEQSTSGLDHWGYYNGEYNIISGTSTKTLVPTVYTTAPYVNGWRGWGANREAKATSAKITMLSTITYPTGGFTSFDFEAHSRYNVLTLVDTPVGGLRLRKMVDFQATEKPAVTIEYEYKDSTGYSSAICTPPPVYDQPSTYTKQAGCLADFTRYSVTISASSVIGLGSFQGSHIGYERVTEYKSDPLNSQTLGKTVYYYTVVGTSELEDRIGNGDLEKQEKYNSTGQLLEQVSNTFQYDYSLPGIVSRKLLNMVDQSSKVMYGYNSTTHSYAYFDPAGCGSTAGYALMLEVPTQYWHTENFVPLESRQLTQQTRKVYDATTGNYLTTVKKYTYGNSDYNYPTLTEERNSLNEKVFTAIKHVGDYVISCSPDPGSMASKVVAMQNANMVSLPVETVKYLQDSTGSNPRYITGQYVESIMGQPQKMYLLKTRPLLSTFTSSAASCTTSPSIDSHYELEASMEYDNNHNLIGEAKANDITTSYFWDHQERLPVAKITNAAQGNAAYASFESDGNGTWDYLTAGITASDGSVTGQNAFILTSGRNLQRTSLDTGQTYILTYWLKTNGATVNIDKGSASGGNGGSVLLDKHGWKLYQKEIQMHGESVITMSGTGIVDEVRLFPKTSQMVTCTYAPLVGMTMQCDANNRITYYEYDLLNRLLRIRDMDKNIIKSFSYTYQQVQ